MVASCLADFTIFCSFYLFQLYNYTIEINFVGAIIPIIFSLFLVAIVKKRKLALVAKYSLVVCALFTIAWSSSDAITNTITTPGYLFILVLVATSLLLLHYNPFEREKNSAGSLLLQLYVIGTFGIFFSDIVRMSAGIFGIPYLGIDAPLLIIGGAGPSDGVFLGGVYLMLFFVISVVLVRRFKQFNRSGINHEKISRPT